MCFFSRCTHKRKNMPSKSTSYAKRVKARDSHKRRALYHARKHQEVAHRLQLARRVHAARLAAILRQIAGHDAVLNMTHRAVDGSRAELAQKEQEIQGLQSQLAAKQRELQLKTDEVARLRADVKPVAVGVVGGTVDKAKLEELQEKLADAESKKAQVDSGMAALKTQLNQKDAEIVALKDDIKSKDLTIQTLEAEKGTMQTAMEQLEATHRNEVQSLTSELDDERRKLADARADLDKATSELEEANRRLATCEKPTEELARMTTDLEKCNADKATLEASLEEQARKAIEDKAIAKAEAEAAALKQKEELEQKASAEKLALQQEALREKAEQEQLKQELQLQLQQLTEQKELEHNQCQERIDALKAEHEAWKIEKAAIEAAAAANQSKLDAKTAEHDAVKTALTELVKFKVGEQELVGSKTALEAGTALADVIEQIDAELNVKVKPYAEALDGHSRDLETANERMTQLQEEIASLTAAKTRIEQELAELKQTDLNRVPLSLPGLSDQAQEDLKNKLRQEREKDEKQPVEEQEDNFYEAVAPTGSTEVAAVADNVAPSVAAAPEATIPLAAAAAPAAPLVKVAAEAAPVAPEIAPAPAVEAVVPLVEHVEPPAALASEAVVPVVEHVEPVAAVAEVVSEYESKEEAEAVAAEQAAVAIDLNNIDFSKFNADELANYNMAKDEYQKLLIDRNGKTSYQQCKNIAQDTLNGIAEKLPKLIQDECRNQDGRIKDKTKLCTDLNKIFQIQQQDLKSPKQ